MKVFVDSNVFIFANIEEYPEHDIAKKGLLNLVIDSSKILINSM